MRNLHLEISGTENITDTEKKKFEIMMAMALLKNLQNKGLITYKEYSAMEKDATNMIKAR